LLLALVLPALALPAAPAAAQDEQSLSAPADLHREPSGAPLVTLPAGAPVETGERQGDWREVTVEGWIYTPSTSPTRRDGYDLVVSEDEGENLRRSPNGPVVGRAREGTLLERVGQKGKWTRVRREGWVPRTVIPAQARQAAQAQEPAAPARGRTAGAQGRAPRPAAGAKPPAPPTGTPVDPAVSRFRTARVTQMAAIPEGPALATLPQGAPTRVLSRAGEWSRVQVEGWVRDADLEAGDGGALSGVTAEEVRAQPDRYVGQTLDWRLQLIAVQTADELRSELPPGQPYLLTRGPLPEPGFVYVAIPSDRVEAFRALPPLQEVVLRVTIRAARTRYLTTPVAELVSVVSGMDAT
jgi:hypothetical protein